MIQTITLVQPVYAHGGEEVETGITLVDYAGPVIALLIIIVAGIIARRIHKK